MEAAARAMEEAKLRAPSLGAALLAGHHQHHQHHQHQQHHQHPGIQAPGLQPPAQHQFSMMAAAAAAFAAVSARPGSLKPLGQAPPTHPATGLLGQQVPPPIPPPTSSALAHGLPPVLPSMINGIHMDRIKVWSRGNRG